MGDLEEISIEPSTNLIDVLASEYSFNSAVCDLIDNCIDGQADIVNLYFVKEDAEYSLLILDNGPGMSKTKLKEAAVIGFKSSDDSRNSSVLGRFSTGLKSASNFLGTSVCVVSKTNKEINALKIDFRELKTSGQWKAVFLNSYPFESLISSHGTAVICQNLKEIKSDDDLLSKLESLRLYIDHIFGKYLLDNKMKISISKSLSCKPVALTGWSPFFLLENKSTKCVLTKSIEYKKKKIHFKIYILPSYSSLSNLDQNYMRGGGENNNLNKLQGFYIYRSGRLISEAGWLLPDFDITEKTRYARIEVQIPSSLDKEFNVNLTKTKVLIPKDIEGHFRAIAKKARNESNKNYDYKKHPEIKPSIVAKQDTIWINTKTSKGNVLRLNKDSVVLKDLCKKMNEQEYKNLISLISKSFPYGFASSQPIDQEIYTANEISSMVKNLYISLKEQNFTIKEIYSKIIQSDPFNNEKYRSQVINVLEELDGEDKHD